MRPAQFLRIGLVMTGLLAVGNAAQAVPVNFITLGSFSGGTGGTGPTYNDGAAGVNIAFGSSVNNNVTAPPATGASFGTFDTSATTATAASPGTISGIFTLTILESSPDAGSVSFVGTLHGSLSDTSSQAYIQFTGPLSQTIGGTTFSIVSADGPDQFTHVAGRVNLSPKGTNFGVSSIAGLVNVAVPEPASLVLMGLGIPAIGAIAHLRRRRASVGA